MLAAKSLELRQVWIEYMATHGAILKREIKMEGTLEKTGGVRPC